MSDLIENSTNTIAKYNQSLI